MTVAQKTTHFICLRTTDSITYGHSYCDITCWLLKASFEALR